MPAKSKKVTEPSSTSKAVVAKSDDGSIQITFTVPFKRIETSRKEAASELGKNIEVPGFRKGKAPLDKLISHIPQNTLLEKTLFKILPDLIAKAIREHKLTLAVYPKFELVKAKDGEDWQVRALTCEIPEFKLGDYKKKIAGALRAKTLWKPGDDKKPPSKSDSEAQLEKEQAVIKALLETIEVKIPKMLIEEEVNSRLSRLLEKIEKLGLNLDSYLTSIGKTADKLRAEYKKQASETIKLDLILTKIAQVENIKVNKKQVDEALGIGSGDQKLTEERDTPQRRNLIEAILRKRAALAHLISLS